MSDLILKTQGANGRELHTSKHFLAWLSPHFHNLFSGTEWNEKSVLNLGFDYEVVKQALRILYQSAGSKVAHSPEEIYQLFVFAHKCDFPKIRATCRAELASIRPCVESLKVSLRCGFHEITAKQLGSYYVCNSDIKNVVDAMVGENNVRFNAEEVKIIMRNLHPTMKTKSLNSECRQKSKRPVADPQSPIPKDFGSAWLMSDLVLRTSHSNDRELHVSKHVLATHSSYFQAMFFGAEWIEKSSGELKIDDDYHVVREALRILYQIGRISVDLELHSPRELLHLYTFADKYDFPMIRNLCKEELASQPSSWETLEVSVRLELHDVTIRFLKNLSHVTIFSFVDKFIRDRGVSFNGREVQIMMKKTQDRADALEEQRKRKRAAEDSDASD